MPRYTPCDAEWFYGALTGTVQPVVVASPFAGHGNALSFDGVSRADNTQTVDCGKSHAILTQGTGVAAAFCYETSVKTGAITQGATYVAMGRNSGVKAGGRQSMLYITAPAGSTTTSVLSFSTAASGAADGALSQIWGTVAIQPNTLYSFAVTYDGVTMRIFVNGVLDGSLALASVEAADFATSFSIGNWSPVRGSASGGHPWLGIIDEVRISKIARYTANYTPQTAPLALDASTIGLWLMDEFRGATTKAEINGLSSRAALRAGVGPDKLPTFTGLDTDPFGKVLTFDGVNRGVDSQGAEAGTGLMVTGPFCLEARVKTGAVSSAGGTQYIVAGKYKGASTKTQPVLYLSVISGALKLSAGYVDSGNTLRGVNGATTIAQNTAYVFAFSFDGSTMRVFVNGALDGSLSGLPAGVQADDGTVKFMIGRDDDAGASTNGGFPWLGTIDEVRLSSTARYTAAYTPATALFTTDANTMGLWHLNAASGNVTKRRVVRSTQTAPNSGTLADWAITDGATANANTIAAFSGAAGPSSMLFIPNATATVADGGNGGANQAARNVGWRDVVAESNDQVTYEVGTWTFRGRLTKSGQTLAADQSVKIVHVLFWISAGGVSTEIGRGYTSELVVSTAVYLFSSSFITSLPVVVPPGGKLQVEVHIQGIAAGLVAAPTAAVNISYNVDSLVDMTSTPDYSVQAVRSLSESSPSTDVVVRSAIQTRATSDTAPMADSLTKVSILPRSVSDTAPASDAATRRTAQARSVADTSPAADAATRQTTQARSISDPAPATDAANRRTTQARSVTDAAPSSDVVTRVLIAPRSISDSAPASDALTRKTTQARSLGDTAPAADTATRALIQVRDIGENIGPNATDFPIRFGTKRIADVVLNHEPVAGVNEPIVGATVKLFRQSDDRVVQTTTSGAGGAYSFVRDQFDNNEYYVLCYYEILGVQYHGVSDRGIVAAFS